MPVRLGQKAGKDHGPGIPTIVFKAILGADCFRDLDSSQGFDRIDVNLWGVRSGPCGSFVDCTSDIVMAVRLWTNGLRRFNNW